MTAEAERLVADALKPFRSELEQGLQMIETGADWNVASAYDKAGFTITRIVMSAETAIRVEDLAARRGVSKSAALAVIETVLITQHRAGTADRIRSPAAYLGGILKRPPGECLPEITLGRLGANTNVRVDIPLALVG